MRKEKEQISLEIWTGKKPNLNYVRKFGCLAYFHIPKTIRNKFDIPGRRGIMLGYARDRRGYRVYEVKNKKVIEEHSIKFNEMIKCSKYFGLSKFSVCWDIELLINKNFLDENEMIKIK